MSLQDIILNDHQWYIDNGIELLLNNKVTKIDRKGRKIFAEDGSEREYDRLLLATGSTPSSCRCPARTCPA